MHDYNKKSIDLHKKLKGVLSTQSKVKLNTKEALSLAYTPGVGAVSLEISKNKSKARDLTIKSNTVAVVSDGSSVLGLGNLGPEAAIPVMEGKSVLFKEFAQIDAFPICLDTQDTEEIIKTVKNIAPVFGGINLEDISAPRCFEIEDRLKKELDIPVFHDDQHGTAVVVLAGIINTLLVKGLKESEARVVINGAGAAGLSIAKILLGNNIKNIIVCDSKGIIYKNRANLNEEKKKIAKLTNLENKKGNLSDALVGANIFIGVSIGNVLNEKMIKSMSEKPIIFALANPIPEIYPEQAKKYGAFIIATGRSDYENQVNNVLAFPGIFRGALDNNVRFITDTMLVRAAHALASCVSKPNKNKILPNPFDKNVVSKISKAIF